MLRRESEDGAAAEIQLHSKEAGDATAPVLVIVNGAGDAPPDADAADGLDGMEDAADAAPDWTPPPDVPIDGEGTVDAHADGDAAGDQPADAPPDMDGTGGSGGCGCVISL